MTNIRFKKMMLNSAIAFSLTVVASHAQEAPVEEKDAYLLQFNTEYADGGKVVSSSQEVMVGRARAGEYSQVYMDMRNGAVTVETLEGTDTRIVDNDTPTEKAYVYDYQDDKVHGDDVFARYFNNYISKHIGDGNAVGQEAKWVQSVNLSDLAFFSVDDPEISIEISRRFEGEGDDKIAVIEFNTPAFEYLLYDGSKYIQWGQGVAITDDMFGTLHVMGTSHRAVVMDASGNKRPIAMKTTAYGMMPDGSLRLDMDNYPLAQQAINTVTKTTSGDIHPAHYDISYISTSHAPFDLANGIQMLAFAAGEKSANMINMASSLSMNNMLGQLGSTQSAGNSLNVGTSSTSSNVTSSPNNSVTSSEVRNLMTQMLLQGVPGNVPQQGQSQINLNAASSMSVTELIDVLDLANQGLDGLAAIQSAAPQSSNSSSGVNSAFTTALQNMSAIINDPTILPSPSNNQAALGFLEGGTLEEFYQTSANMEKIRDAMNGLISDTIANKVAEQGTSTSSPVSNGDFVQMMSALGKINERMGVNANLSTNLEGGGLSEAMSGINESLGNLSGLLGAVMGQDGASNWHVPDTGNSSMDMTQGQLDVLAGLSEIMGGGGLADLSNNNAQNPNDIMGGLSDVMSKILANSEENPIGNLLQLDGLNTEEKANVFENIRDAMQGLTGGESGEGLIGIISGISDLEPAEQERILENLRAMEGGMLQGMNSGENQMGVLPPVPGLENLTEAERLQIAQNIRDAFQAMGQGGSGEASQSNSGGSILTPGNPQALLDIILNSMEDSGGNNSNRQGGGSILTPGNPQALLDLVLGSMGDGNTGGTNNSGGMLITPNAAKLLEALNKQLSNGENQMAGDLTDQLDDLVSKIAKEAEAQGGGTSILREIDKRDPNDPTWKWGRDDDDTPPIGPGGNRRPSDSDNPLGLSPADYRDEMARRKMELDLIQLELMMEKLYEEAEREERWRKRREGEGIFDSDNFYNNTDDFFDNNAMEYGDMIGYINTDLSKWEEWLSTQDIALLTRLAEQAGYPREVALAAALADAANLIRNARDEGFRRWANSPPSCAGMGGCGPQYLERWTMKKSQLALGDILRDARGIFSTAGLSDISISGFQLGYVMRDYGLEDGDIVDVTISQFGREIFNTEITLLNGGTNFNVNLRPGVAAVEIRAINEGYASPNTAEININNVVTGDARQTYSLNTGEVATLRIEPGR